MNVWTYRVARIVYDKNGNDYFDMREYFPDVEGERLWSAESEVPVGENIDDLIWALRHMLKAAKKARRRPELLLILQEDGEEV